MPTNNNKHNFAIVNALQFIKYYYATIVYFVYSIVNHVVDNYTTTMIMLNTTRNISIYL